LARPTSTNLHALDGWPPRSAGTGARFSAHEIASTLTGHPAAAAERSSATSVVVIAWFSLLTRRWNSSGAGGSQVRSCRPWLPAGLPYRAAARAGVPRPLPRRLVGSHHHR